MNENSFKIRYGLYLLVCLQTKLNNRICQTDTIFFFFAGPHLLFCEFCFWCPLWKYQNDRDDDDNHDNHVDVNNDGDKMSFFNSLQQYVTSGVAGLGLSPRRFSLSRQDSASEPPPPIERRESNNSQHHGKCNYYFF